MAYETSHILYEWEPTIEVEIAGEKRRYSDGYRSLIIHRLSDLSGYPQIPAHALKTPVWHSGYLDKWVLANGQDLRLPHKLL
jgi:hypothetical protein